MSAPLRKIICTCDSHRRTRRGILLLTGALLGEPLMGYHVVGFALILIGVWIAAIEPIT